MPGQRIGHALAQRVDFVSGNAEALIDATRLEYDRGVRAARRRRPLCCHRYVGCDVSFHVVPVSLAEGGLASAARRAARSPCFRAAGTPRPGPCRRTKEDAAPALRPAVARVCPG